MSHAVVIDFAPPQPEPSPAHKRIRRLSGALAWLFTALLAAAALFYALLGTAFFVPAVGAHIGIGPTGMILTGLPHMPAPYVPASGLPLIQRLAHIPVGLIDFAPSLAVLFSLRRLFGLYARGVVFAADNARCIRWIGLALIAAAVAPGLGVLFLTSLHLVVDHRWLHPSIVQELILGAVVYVIAEVMQVGHEIEQESEQFV